MSPGPSLGNPSGTLRGPFFVGTLSSTGEGMAEDQQGETVRTATRLWFSVEGGKGDAYRIHRRHWTIPLEVPRSALEPRKTAGGPDTPKPT
jgi:hypothetical protein